MLQTLPGDILIRITLFLPFSSLLAFRAVSHEFRKLQESLILRYKYIRGFVDVPIIALIRRDYTTYFNISFLFPEINVKRIIKRDICKTGTKREMYIFFCEHPNKSAYILNKACKYNNRPVCDSFCSNEINLSDPIHIIDAFRVACENNYIHSAISLAKYLTMSKQMNFKYANSFWNSSSPDWKQKLVNNTCKNGHLRILEWLYKYDFCADFNVHFIAHKYGHSRILKWLNHLKYCL